MTNILKWWNAVTFNKQGNVVLKKIFKTSVQTGELQTVFLTTLQKKYYIKSQYEKKKTENFSCMSGDIRKDCKA
jgi:hypothetical protein